MRSRAGEIPRTIYNTPILALLERNVSPEEFAEGVRYAALGQIVSFEVDTGVVEGKVQGTAGRPYEVSITLGAFTQDEWDRVIDAMAAEAVYVVKLLAGEMPEGLIELLAAHDLALLPGSDEAMKAGCSCRAIGPCRHIVALGAIVADEIASDPLLLLALRGMPIDRVLERLRQSRMIQAHGVASAHADPMIPETQRAITPLEACVDEYWRPGPRLSRLRELPPPDHVPHALLRRLGPPPMQGRFPLVGLLASIYDEVSKRAIEIRDKAEGVDGGE